MRAVQGVALVVAAGAVWAEQPATVPDNLKPWIPWVLEGQESRLAPPHYDNAQHRPAYWPSRLDLIVEPEGAQFALEAEVFAETWVLLPGGEGAWPQKVTAAGKLVPVLEREGTPAVRLPAGRVRIEGRFSWRPRPARLKLPPSTGLLHLTLDGQDVLQPAWEPSGWLWLSKPEAPGAEPERDFLSAELFGLIEDGNPLWLRQELVLTIAGKSREENLGRLLPQGWQLASLDSPIPAVVDSEGMLRVQARAGQWTLRLSAFRLDNPTELEFGPQPIVASMLLGLRPAPEFRLVELKGAEQVDASQTSFPAPWREFPVFRWELAQPLHLAEIQRGSGYRAAPGLAISRQWWLDFDGRGITFQDRLRGENLELWRLDAAPGAALGTVRVEGQGQLITRNPVTGAEGFEIRTRRLEAEAAGRLAARGALPASGWLAPAGSLEVALRLPPGWRLLAVSGADWSQGAWLPSWTLLDLFVLLVISLAVHRLCGWSAAVLSLAGLGLAFHEPGAPKLIWLALLAPVALLRVVKNGRSREVLVWLKWTALIGLGLKLAPFAAAQLQQALYPQLERLPPGVPAPVLRVQEGSASEPARPQTWDSRGAEADFSSALPPTASALAAPLARAVKGANENLLQDASARIQTGPAVPEWSWREVRFGWNGPVAPEQSVHPWLLPAWLERLLSALRVVLLIGLAVVLARPAAASNMAASPPPLPQSSAAAVATALLLTSISSAHADFPPSEMLQELRARLLKTPEVFPGAAEISEATLEVEGRRLAITATVEAAARCAVPVPGRFTSWSPVSVLLDGLPAAAIRREDGSLWVVVEPGVRTMRAEGFMPGGSQWEWSFRLRPRKVLVAAPGWQVSGVAPDGSPEERIFLTREQAAETAAASGFDRQELEPVARVQRGVELGLRWRVRTLVRRLSPPGRSFSLRIPLLDGEQVLAARALPQDGSMEAHFGPQDQEFLWESELTMRERLRLRTRREDRWAEEWRLEVSPVWNVTFQGLAPVFEPGSDALIPVWKPWPGESVEIAVFRPEAVPGPTTTIRRVKWEISAGQRQATGTLRLDIHASLGSEFPIELPEGAEVTRVARAGEDQPVRMRERTLLATITPGEQQLDIEWRQPAAASGMLVRMPEVRLPLESANLSMALRLPEDRWVLWASGPALGPAVRFWAVLALALAAAWVLARAQFTPLRLGTWVVLGLGLTQVPFAAAAVVVGWFFILGLKTREGWQRLPPWLYNLGQIALAGLTLAAAAVLLTAVGAGLLGRPEMFIAGNGSSANDLRWFLDRSSPSLAQPSAIAVSIWWYRLAMLAWALWLAFSVLNWVGWAWRQFATGGLFRERQSAQAVGSR